MAKIKISDLPELTTPSSNTLNTFFIVTDIESGTPVSKKMSASTLDVLFDVTVVRANAAFAQSNIALTQANSAFIEANAAIVHAQSAFNVANTADDFSAVNPAYWATSAPTTVQTAVDRLANLVYTLNSSTPIP